jgi:hypothetical protein
MNADRAVTVLSAIVAAFTAATTGAWMATNRKAWRLAVPIALWCLNWLMFLAMVLACDTYRWRYALNLWGQVLMLHAAATFMLYLLIMRVGRRRSNGGGE